MLGNSQGAATPVINEIIEGLNEREAGYKKALELVEDPTAATIFQGYADQSSRFAQELMPYSDQKSREEIGTGPLSTVFRGWAELKATVTGKDTHGIYAWCETGEDAAKGIYQGAYKTGIPDEVKIIVDRQFAEIKEAHDRIKALRDS